MTWKEMVKNHPNKWLVLRNCVYDKTNNTTLIEADIHEVFESPEELNEFRDNHIGKGYRYEYTGKSPRGWTNYIISRQNSNEDA